MTGRLRPGLLSLALLLTGLTGGSAVAGAVAPTSARTADARWHGGGPFGGSVCTMAMAGSRMYAVAGSAGPYASDDRGASWQRRGGGLPADFDASGVTPAPSRPSRVWMSSFSFGIWRSDDSGGHWQRVHTAGTVLDVGVDPVDPDIAYAGVDPYTFVKTTNAGATWTDLLEGSESLDSDIVVVAPSDRNRVYTAGLQVHRSDDAGATWHTIGTPAVMHVRSLAVSPADPDVVVAGTWFGGLYRTTDAGQSWQQLPLPSGGVGLESVAFDPAAPARVYVGTMRPGEVFVSEDHGSHWARRPIRVPSGAAGNEVCELLVHPTTGAVYAGLSRSGLWVSSDRGRSWAARDRGLVGSMGASLAVVPRHPREAFAGTWGDGVYRTTDAGRTWRPRGLSGRIVSALATWRSHPGLVLAGTEVGVFRSTDAGRTWRKVTRGRLSLQDIAFAPSRPQVVYASDFRGILKSRDFGRTWVDLRVRPEYGYLGIAVSPADHRDVWVSTRSSGVARTTDGGRTWRLNGCCLSPSFAHDLAVSPADPRVVYAASDYGAVMRSTKSGRDGTWRMITPPTVDDGYAIVLDPRRPRTLYVGTIGPRTPGGVYRSTDGGRSWHRIVTGMWTTWTTALAMTPGGRLYAGTAAYGLASGGGVFTRRMR